MAKALSSLFLLCGIFALSIASMMYGWGLQPISWGWIIGGYFGVATLAALGEVVRKCQ